MLLQGEKYNYEVIKTNHQTHAYSVVEIVKGQSFAASRADYHRNRLTPEERDVGWSFYTERTTKAVTYKPPAPQPLKRDRTK